jgi:hypothetical protein
MRITYPENWTEQEIAAPVELTELQRHALKDLVKAYINNKGQGFTDSQLVKTAQKYVLTNYGKHIHDTVLRSIIDEIHEEWKDTWTFLAQEEDPA